MSATESLEVIPSHIYCRPGSKADHALHRRQGRQVSAPSPEATAGGFGLHQELDLIDRGGKVIPDLTYKTFYVGGAAAWNVSDISNIDRSLAAIMTDTGLNNVIVQYLRGDPVGTNPKPSSVLPDPAAASISQDDLEEFVKTLQLQGKLDGFPLDSTVFNFMLPSGTQLTLGESPAQRKHATYSEVAPGNAAGIPVDDEDSSLDGLGGFHGSVHVSVPDSDPLTIYYAVGVFSEILADGRENGIVVFPDSWKNVVATFYHELCEARTDPDVGDAIRNNDSAFVGWSSSDGSEIGDIPMNLVGSQLSKVIREITLGNGETAPLQFQWSNFVHSPEGRAASPHPPA
ncbi:MAG: hypothetical protein JWM11_3938 [Planctomycetaceae bacterium]|nr:hypothetical protein [Planctomycetaceae bacterium]